MSSLVYLLVWSPPPHIPYISSPNQCLLFATHAHTIASVLNSWRITDFTQFHVTAFFRKTFSSKMSWPWNHELDWCLVIFQWQAMWLMIFDGIWTKSVCNEPASWTQPGHPLWVGGMITSERWEGNGNNMMIGESRTFSVVLHTIQPYLPICPKLHFINTHLCLNSWIAVRLQSLAKHYIFIARCFVYLYGLWRTALLL